jgi:DNA helicase-2/ATP-dependent DNA helicase PcrA
MYPYIILDEFQDTNGEQWRVVQGFGKCSELIALADPKQRIFDFIGADPKRLDHFRDQFCPTEIDFSDANHRSAGTDIARFGNDVLTGSFSQTEYSGVAFDCFPPAKGPAFSKLVTTTYQARKRLLDSGQCDWSLAILVPTKQMTRFVSEAFRSPPGNLSPVPHSAVIELEAAILGSDIIAHLLQPQSIRSKDVLVELLCNYFEGKGGDSPTKKALNEANSFRAAHEKWQKALANGKKPPGNSILVKTFAVSDAVRDLKLTGDPGRDWRSIRGVLENGECSRLKEIGREVRNIRLLERGSQLQAGLGEDWRENGCYANALEIVRQAFVQEHFATSSKPESGVVVMNMHKAKGKQFDEVIIFEGWSQWSNRIVRGNDQANINEGVLQNFRVSVTRGRKQTTILTPNNDPCVLLGSRSS